MLSASDAKMTIYQHVVRLTGVKILKLSFLVASTLFTANAVGARDDGFKTNVAVVDRDMLAFMQKYQRPNFIDLDAEATARIAEMVEADGIVTPRELYFLSELVGGAAASLKLTTPDNKTEYRDMSAVQRVILSDEVAPLRAAVQREYARLWESGETGHALLLNHHLIGKTQATELARFVATERLNAPWAESKIANAYKPIRSEIDEMMRRNNALEPEQQDDGRRMIDGWMRELDERNQNEVPRYLFRWIAPKSGN